MNKICIEKAKTKTTKHLLHKFNRNPTAFRFTMSMKVNNVNNNMSLYRTASRSR